MEYAAIMSDKAVDEKDFDKVILVLPKSLAITLARVVGAFSSNAEPELELTYEGLVNTLVDDLNVSMEELFPFDLGSFDDTTKLPEPTYQLTEKGKALFGPGGFPN